MKNCFENKLLNAIDAALSWGYDNANIGVINAGDGAKASKLIGANSDEIIQGEILWIIVEEEDLHYFEEHTKPDRDYSFGDGNQRIYVYFA